MPSINPSIGQALTSITKHCKVLPSIAKCTLASIDQSKYQELLKFQQKVKMLSEQFGSLETIQTLNVKTSKLYIKIMDLEFHLRAKKLCHTRYVDARIETCLWSSSQCKALN